MSTDQMPDALPPAGYEDPTNVTGRAPIPEGQAGDHGDELGRPTAGRPGL